VDVYVGSDVELEIVYRLYEVVKWYEFMKLDDEICERMELS